MGFNLVLEDPKPQSTKGYFNETPPSTPKSAAGRGAQKMNKEAKAALIHTHGNNCQQRIIGEESVQSCLSIRPKSASISAATSFPDL